MAETNNLDLMENTNDETVDKLETNTILPLTRVTLETRTEAVYKWINGPSFSTGLLVSNIQDKIILEEEKSFPVPKRIGMFETDPLFSPEFFNGIFVLDCDPVRKGVLSLHTEMIIIENSHSKVAENNSFQDATCIKERIINEDENGTLIDFSRTIFLSDFTVPLTRRNSKAKTGKILDFIAADTRGSKKAPVASFHMVEDYPEFNQYFKTKSDLCYDIFNSVLVAKRHAKHLCVFDGDFVELTTVDKNSKAIKYSQNHAVFNVKVVDDCNFQTQNEHAIFALPTVAYTLYNTASHSPRVVVQRYKALSQELDGSSCSTSWILRPSYASQLHISCVHSPTYNCQLAYANILQAFFNTPRLVRKHMIIAVPTSDDVEFWQTENELCNVRKPVLYFKVVQLYPKLKGEYTYLADCAHTTLILEPSTHSFVPTIMNTSVRRHQPSIPPGLETHHETIVEWFRPYTCPKLKESVSDMCTSVLVSGNNGCGKSSLIHAVATSLHMHCFEVNCHELCGETSAATETRIKHVVQRASNFSPCILSLRNVDALGKDRDGNSEDLRVAGSFNNILYSTVLDNPKYPVLVIASTSSLKSVCKDIKNVFMYTLNIEVANESTRETMLSTLLKGTFLHHSINTKHIAQRTAGMNLGDIKCLIAKATRNAHARIVNYWREKCGRNHMTEEDETMIADSGVKLKAEDFDQALKDMQKAHTSSIGAPQIPNVSWEDVGGLKNVKQDILDTIQLPLEHPYLFTSGLRRSGVLFYGPPGTGKTLLAKAVATECSLNFLSVKGPELLNMYVGQSEENVREVFEKARGASPCVIFFDELDSLAPNRGRSGDSGGVMDRVVSQLLAELDGLSKSSDVFVIGATNRPDLLDPALLRPGRFDKLLYLGVSEDRESQLHILRALTRKFKLHEDCELEEIVEQCPFNMTGADFYALCSDAMLNALKRKICLLQQGQDVDQSEVDVQKDDFSQALENLVPSISVQELERYRLLQRQLQENR